MDLLRSPRHKVLVAAAALGGLLVLAAFAKGGQTGLRVVLAGAGIAAVAFFWKKRGAPSEAAEPRLKVLSKTGLSQRCGLALVEADGKTVLVAFGDGFAQLLESKPAQTRRRAAKKAVQP